MFRTNLLSFCLVLAQCVVAEGQLRNPREYFCPGDGAPVVGMGVGQFIPGNHAYSGIELTAENADSVNGLGFSGGLTPEGSFSLYLPFAEIVSRSVGVSSSWDPTTPVTVAFSPNSLQGGFFDFSGGGGPGAGAPATLARVGTGGPASCPDPAGLAGACDDNADCRATEYCSGAPDCRCVSFPTPTPTPAPPRTGEQGDARAQPDWDDFEPKGSDSAGNLVATSKQSDSQTTQAKASVTGTSVPERYDRGGNWYNIHSYPGGLANINPAYSPSGAIQIYWYNGHRWNFEQISSSSGVVNRLSWVEDAHGNRRTYLYGASGRLSETRAGGIKTLFNWVGPRDLEIITLSCKAEDYADCPYEANHLYYRYNSQGQVVSIEGPERRFVAEPSTNQPHDLDNLIAGRPGLAFDYSGGQLWKIWRTNSALGPQLVAQYAYHPDGKLLSSTDAFGNVVTYSYPVTNGFRQVVETAANGDESRWTFDGFDRPNSVRYAPGRGRQDHINFREVRVSHAKNDSCNRMVQHMWENRGVGETEVLRAGYDVANYRMTDLSVVGPAGNWITTTWSDFLDGLEGNKWQKEISRSGVTERVFELALPSDTSDARLVVRGEKINLPTVTDLDGKDHQVAVLKRYTEDGRIAFVEHADGRVTSYDYEEGYPQKFLIRTIHGPATGAGKPNLDDPSTAYVTFARDFPSGRIEKIALGKLANQGVTEFEYDDRDLREIRTGSAPQRIRRLFYSQWGSVAAEGAFARRHDGERFAPNARDWYWTHFLRTPEGLLRATLTDIGDPRKSTPEWDEQQNHYTSDGQLSRVLDAFGRGVNVETDGWGVKRIRSTVTGAVLNEWTRFPLRTDERTLLGELNGQPSYGTTEHKFLPGGFLAEVKDAVGHTLKFIYDLEGRVAAVQQLFNQNLLAESASRFDQWGRTVSHVSRNPVSGVETILQSIKFDPFRIAEVRDRKGRKTTFSYDRGGQLLRQQDPLFARLYSYSPEGRLAQIEVSTGSYRWAEGWGYDADGRVTRYSNLGNGTDSPITTSYRYDSLGRSVPKFPDGQTPEVNVGPDGRVWSRTMESGAEITFDHKRDLAAGTYTVRRTIPREGTKGLVFGPFGLQEIQESDGTSTRYSYGTFGFLASITGRDGTTTTPHYDSFGRLVGSDVVTGSRVESSSLARDSRDRIVEFIKTVGSKTWKRRFGYGDFSELAWLEADNPGEATRRTTFGRLAPDGVYQPDALSSLSVGGVTWKFNSNPQTGLLDGIDLIGGPFTTDQPLEAVRFTYDGAIRNSITYGQGAIKTQWGYDSRGALSALASVANGSTSSIKYHRDVFGRVVQETMSGAGHGLGKHFKYEGSRLSGIKQQVTAFGDSFENTIANDEVEIDYDPSHPYLRQQIKSSSSGSTEYSLGDSGKFDKIGDNKIDYDRLERVVRFGELGFEYEGDSLLPNKILRNGQVRYDLEYAPDGNLLKSTDSAGQIRRYEHLGSTSLGRWDSQGQLIEADITYPGISTERLAKVDLRSGEVQYFTHFDPSRMVGAYDSSGKLIEGYDTEYPQNLVITAPTGASLPRSAIANDRGFHNLTQLDDLSFTPNRVLLPGGIFNAPDPADSGLGNPGQRFLYGNADERNRTDSSGLQSSTIGESIAWAYHGATSTFDSAMAEIGSGINWGINAWNYGVRYAEYSVGLRDWEPTWGAPGGAPLDFRTTVIGEPVAAVGDYFRERSKQSKAYAAYVGKESPVWGVAYDAYGRFLGVFAGALEGGVTPDMFIGGGLASSTARAATRSTLLNATEHAVEAAKRVSVGELSSARRAVDSAMRDLCRYSPEELRTMNLPPLTQVPGIGLDDVSRPAVVALYRGTSFPGEIEGIFRKGMWPAYATGIDTEPLFSIEDHVLNLGKWRSPWTSFSESWEVANSFAMIGRRRGQPTFVVNIAPLDQMVESYPYLTRRGLDGIKGEREWLAYSHVLPEQIRGLTLIEKVDFEGESKRVPVRTILNPEFYRWSVVLTSSP